MITMDEWNDDEVYYLSDIKDERTKDWVWTSFEVVREAK